MSFLKVSDVGKAFRNYRTEWHRIGHLCGLPFKPVEETWVLRHASFEVRPGESLGIIGQNGAGKSTLLKIITGTLAPTEGSVFRNGRIGAILELGMGFHPELTGRQNSVIAAGLLGHSSEEITKTLPEIEEFAEIGDYFDEPVRTYSSGMNMRLAFSVATSFQPDVLIVDEALSVGDAYFIHKCNERIRNYQENGMSLLIVSHDSSAIQSLCDRALLLEQGTVIRHGNPDEVIDCYKETLGAKERSSAEAMNLTGGATESNNQPNNASIIEVRLSDNHGNDATEVRVGESLLLRVRVEITGNIESLALGYAIYDQLGQVIFGTSTRHFGQVIDSPKPGELYDFKMTFFANLGVGAYSIRTALTDDLDQLSIHSRQTSPATVFNVINVDKPTFIGCLSSDPAITIEKRVS